MLTVSEIKQLGGFPIVYADPPWSYDQRGRGAAENHYRTMTLAEIKALPIGELASPDAVLFLWATMPLLPEALDVGRAWGFEYKTCAFSWVKYHEKSGKPAMGGGMWTRANVELCLLFVRGEPSRRVSAAVRQLVEQDSHERGMCDCGHMHAHTWDPSTGIVTHYVPECNEACGCGGWREPANSVLRAPRGAHSAKPASVRQRIDELMGPDLPRVELFARERVEGWSAWGNEIESDFDM